MNCEKEINKLKEEVETLKRLCLLKNEKIEILENRMNDSLILRGRKNDK